MGEPGGGPEIKTQKKKKKNSYLKNTSPDKKIIIYEIKRKPVAFPLKKVKIRSGRGTETRGRTTVKGT